LDWVKAHSPAYAPLCFWVSHPAPLRVGGSDLEGVVHGSNLAAVPFGYTMEARHLRRAVNAPRNNSGNLLVQIAWD
jgi:hypothetical protein